MASPQILPTVGRVVWFYPSSNTGEAGFARHAGGPYAALISRVWNNGLVNLCVFDANGAAHPRTCVPLEHGDQPVNTEKMRCEWMPFQNGQAAKAETTEKVTATAPATQQYREPSQRDQLECALVSGAAIHLAANTDQAYKIAAGIKTVLDALHPAPPVAPIAKPDGCQGTNCASVNGLNHLRERMTFGAAIEALKAGQSVARAGWNGKGMFVYLVPAASYPAQTGVAKEHFGEGALVPYAAYLALKNVDGTVNTWAPSVSDALAEDWALAP